MLTQTGKKTIEEICNPPDWHCASVAGLAGHNGSEAARFHCDGAPGDGPLGTLVHVDRGQERRAGEPSVDTRRAIPPSTGTSRHQSRSFFFIEVLCVNTRREACGKHGRSARSVTVDLAARSDRPLGSA